MSPTTPFASTLAHVHRHEENHGFCLVCGGIAAVGLVLDAMTSLGGSGG